MAYLRTQRRKAAKRLPREAGEFTGISCGTCGHYARQVTVQGRDQVICNSNGEHREEAH